MAALSSKKTVFASISAPTLLPLLHFFSPPLPCRTAVHWRQCTRCNGKLLTGLNRLSRCRSSAGADASADACPTVDTTNVE